MTKKPILRYVNQDLMILPLAAFPNMHQLGAAFAGVGQTAPIQSVVVLALAQAKIPQPDALCAGGQK